MRRLLVPLGALLVCLALLALLEVVLRLLGIGDVPEALGSRLRYQQVYLPMLSPGAAPDGTPVLRTTDARLSYQSIAAEKPAGGLRVFCLGGSATAGLGFSPNVTFARYLERMLREAAPDREVEVVNLGMVALPSTGVRLMVEDVCARYEPDAIVVYSGNNEFLELHSQRYFEATASLGARLLNRLGNTNLQRLIRGAETARPVITTRDVASASGDRITHREMLREVEIDDADRAAVVAAYRANLEGIAAASAEAGCALILCTVASNWEWWGLEDLAGEVSLGEIEARLPGADELGRHELLFRRAGLHAAAGEWVAARADYRAALNADPHLRRAADALAVEVRAVCAGTGAVLLDAIERLGAEAPHGVVGFGEFYDYVHFTPRGALLLARDVYVELDRLGLLTGPGTGDLDPARFALEELERIEGRGEDFLLVEDFLGVGERVAEGIGGRDLWKYDRLWDALDARVEADPSDHRARTWRGNLHFFRQGGYEDALADYEAAFELSGSPLVRSNLDRLKGLRRP